jgi:nicotinate-nucleotide pyrophosphorylase (carboxylating)
LFSEGIAMLNNVAEDARRLAALTLSEDGERDLTTDVTVPSALSATGSIEFRTAGVLAGTLYADAVALACNCHIQWHFAEGHRLDQGAVVGVISGDLSLILRAERPLLNLMQRASGIASLTRRFVDAIEGTPCKVLHTRKTAPGLRTLDVTSVLAGGGFLHRMDLAETVMVKDNHWQALVRQGRSLESSLKAARARGAAKVYVEVENEVQVKLACAASADRLLIDNQSPPTVAAWRKIARALAPGVEIEATGGITLGNARAFAEAGADYISIGALTHSVIAADIALEIVPTDQL